MYVAIVTSKKIPTASGIPFVFPDCRRIPWYQLWSAVAPGINKLNQRVVFARVINVSGRADILIYQIEESGVIVIMNKNIDVTEVKIMANFLSLR